MDKMPILSSFIRKKIHHKILPQLTKKHLFITINKPNKVYKSIEHLLKEKLTIFPLQPQVQCSKYLELINPTKSRYYFILSQHTSNHRLFDKNHTEVDSNVLLFHDHDNKIVAIGDDGKLYYHDMTKQKLINEYEVDPKNGLIDIHPESKFA